MSFSEMFGLGPIPLWVAPPVPKPGEWWIVESDHCCPKHVTRTEREVALKTPVGWSTAGSTEDVPDVFFTPLRKIEIWGASLGASAQNGRGNQPTADDTGLQTDPEAEAGTGKRL